MSRTWGLSHGTCPAGVVQEHSLQTPLLPVSLTLVTSVLNACKVRVSQKWATMEWPERQVEKKPLFSAECQRRPRGPGRPGLNSCVLLHISDLQSHACEFLSWPLGMCDADSTGGIWCFEGRVPARCRQRNSCVAWALVGQLEPRCPPERSHGVLSKGQASLCGVGPWGVGAAWQPRNQGGGSTDTVPEPSAPRPRHPEGTRESCMLLVTAANTALQTSTPCPMTG